MPDPLEPKPQRSVGRAALGGIGWIGAGTAVAKVASLIAQFALGWLLAEGDYAVFAAAIAVTGVVGALRNGGVAKLLVQRREDYADIAWPLTRVALGFNLLGGTIVAGLAWPVSQQIGEPVVMWLMLLLAAAFPLNTAPTILQARLRSELRFKDLTVITMCSTILRYGSMIAFAALGFGPFSFV
ncbi:MAG: oligosaccharide flippase family protein, partial [Planctomycetota bacterium]